MANPRVYKLHEIASLLGAELRGDANYEICGVASLEQASPSQLSFLVRTEYSDQLDKSSAGAVIVSQEYASLVQGNALILPNPYLGYAITTKLFDNRPTPIAGIHKTAVIDKSAQVDKSASIGPFTVVESGAKIEANVDVGPGCNIGANVVLGANSRICANVSIYHNVIIGQRVIIHSGSVIGADGFGFANDKGNWEKIAQLGSVEIGDDVEIGACTTIDRGALNNTVIEDGVKIDNQVMVAHNVRIGAHTAIAGCVGISGSTNIGRYCTIAGGVGFVGHLTIADHTHVTGMTMVTKSITEPGSYSSGTAMMPTREWKKSSVRLRQIEDLFKRTKQLERQLIKLKNQGALE